MKIISKGYDPDLGRKFAQGSTGSVIARATPSKTASDKPLMPAGLDSQQQHDWLWAQKDQAQQQANPVNEDPARPETEADGVALGSLRVARWKHQNEQMRKKG